MTSPQNQKKIVVATNPARSTEAAIVAFMHTFMTVIIVATTAYLANS